MDELANFAYSTVAVAPAPAESGATLTLADNTFTQAPPFNAVVWPEGERPLASNAEIIRVTANAAGVLTIARKQEGTPARSIKAGDQIMAAITAKTLTDIDAVKEAKREVSGLPGAGETLVGPNRVYALTLGEATTRKLAAAPAAGDTIIVKVAANGHNLTVEANAGQTIDGKASIEVGSGAGAENDSLTFVYDGGGTWWLV